MKRENLHRFLFVSAVCLLSIPWLTPCAGVMASAALDGVTSGATQRAAPGVPTQQLKEWAAKPGPKFKVERVRSIPKSLLISDEEVSAARGGQSAPRSGAVLGRGVVAVTEGVSDTLAMIDPLTWIAGDATDRGVGKSRRQLVLCESPYVVLQAREIRFVREGKNGPVRLVKARDAVITIITAAGSYSASAGFIHYRGPSQEVILETACTLKSGTQFFFGTTEKNGPVMRLNFVKRTVQSMGDEGPMTFE
ncbi:hypothetical protein [Prosthecobacter sp.]|uniref:hypothetical protein n=1 Tax=Prosthecobacter sp. TaxID=1965333 RepID=UPI003783E29A